MSWQPANIARRLLPLRAAAANPGRTERRGITRLYQGVGRRHG
jgi:hypothetical protein